MHPTEPAILQGMQPTPAHDECGAFIAFIAFFAGPLRCAIHRWAHWPMNHVMAHCQFGSYVLRMALSYGPVLCPMALCPMSHVPVSGILSRVHLCCALHRWRAFLSSMDCEIVGSQGDNGYAWTSCTRAQHVYL